MISCSDTAAKENNDATTVTTTESGSGDSAEDNAIYDDPDIPDDTVLTNFLSEYDLSLYIDTIPYDELCIDKAYLDKQVNDEVQSFLSAYGTLVEYDDEDHEVVSRDSVNIYFTGYPHDKSVEFSEDTLSGMTNASSENGYDLVIGSGSFITAYVSETEPEKNNPGFEDQIIGHKKGETFTITVTFPDSYSSAELEGVVVDFDVTINSISYIQETEVTDALAAENTDFDTAEDFIAELYHYYTKIDVFEGIVDSVTVKDFPDESVDKQDVLVDFLFRDLGLTMTQGRFEELLNDYYEIYRWQYYYYYGISSASALVESAGKDNLMLFFEMDMVQERLAEIVTVVE